jgi:uncharacterized membrane protein
MKVAGLFFSLALLASMLWFPVRTLGLRKNEPTPGYPLSEGLGTISTKFPGAPDIIKYLRDAKPGVVLEAQGNAYDYTTFVSTMSGQRSYLGWANHITLLTKQYEEVGRREKITKEIYENTECQVRKDKAKKEGITFIVYGTLEKTKYPESGQADFSCFENVKESGEYRLFGV